VQNLRAQEIKEKELEAEQDSWFNQARPMVTSTKTWKEKWIEKEEGGSEADTGDEAEPIKRHGDMDVNMVFHLPAEFDLPELDAARLELGAARAIL
jgi:hypothetical protein